MIDFIAIANQNGIVQPSPSAIVLLRRFVASFGITPSTCQHMWETIEDSVPRGGRPKHMLWALYFLKTYGSEHIASNVLQVDEKTYRKWLWIFVELMATIPDVVGINFLI